MKAQLLKHLKSKRVVATFVMGLTIAGISYYSMGLSRDVKNLSLVQNGIRTCFARVAQTFTSKILAESSSVYLDRSFGSTTEECFGETMNRMDEFFSTQMEGLKRQINTLSSDVHWFHDKIEKSQNSLTSVEDAEIFLSNLSSRFEKLEGGRDAIEQRMDQYQEEYSNAVSDLRISLFLSVAIFLMVMGYDLFLRRVRNRFKENIEEEALQELQAVGGISKDKVKEIVNLALKENEYFYCEKLFNRYHNTFATVDEIVQIAPVVSGNLEKQRIRVVSGKTAEEREGLIDEIWNESERVDREEEIRLAREKAEVEKIYDKAKDFVELDMSVMMSGIIARFAERLHERKTIVNFEVEQGAKINGYEEQVMQILFHAFNDAMALTPEGIGSEITIGSKKLGGLSLLSISSHNAGENGNYSSAESIDLQICREFIREVDGKMEFETTDRVSTTKLYFQAISEKKVVQVTKGTKKEILARMNG